jgi:DtxR family Mn-dependent transcriptional regulator
MSDAVEKKVYELLNKPTRSPYGNLIPGLDVLDDSPVSSAGEQPERNLAFPGLTGSVVVRRICESVQTNMGVLRQLHAAGIDPGATVNVAQERDGVTIDRSGDKIRLPREVASRVFVDA